MAVLQKVLAGAIGDTGDFGKRFARGHFRIVFFTKMHIKKLLLGQEVLIRHTFLWNRPITSSFCLLVFYAIIQKYVKYSTSGS